MAEPKPEPGKAETSVWATLPELFAELEGPLLSYAGRLLGETSCAEDVVQEAFMRLQAQFDEVREPQRWLYRTVRNLALNQRRASGKILRLQTAADSSGESEFAEVTDPQPLPDEQIARWEGIGLVRLSLETLDERSRELIHLKFHENLSYKEISAIMGLTPGHVGYLLHHAIKAVADELAKSGVVP